MLLNICKTSHKNGMESSVAHKNNANNLGIHLKLDKKVWISWRKRMVIRFYTHCYDIFKFIVSFDEHVMSHSFTTSWRATLSKGQWNVPILTVHPLIWTCVFSVTRSVCWIYQKHNLKMTLRWELMDTFPMQSFWHTFFSIRK